MKIFKWTRKRETAALLLAQGYSQAHVAREVGVSPVSIWRWYHDPEFMSEMDRLTLMTGISLRAERLRIAMQAVRQRVRDTGGVISERDMLDWLKYAQSETDGVKLDLTTLFEVTQEQLADSGSDRVDREDEN